MNDEVPRIPPLSALLQVLVSLLIVAIFLRRKTHTLCTGYALGTSVYWFIDHLGNL